MKITANNPNRKSWLDVEKDSDFPIQNIPFGVFLTKDDITTIGTRIGNYAIDLAALQQLGYFEGIPLTYDIFMQDSLNDFIADGRTTWRLVRNRIADIFDKENSKLKKNKAEREVVIFNIDDIEMLLPVVIGDYTDFYSSKDHATNVGTMFRDPENALLPNWVHIPVGYHGRSSSIVVSGTKIRRPVGQTMPQGATQPVFGPCKLLDFEVEMGFITTDANKLGKAVPIEEARNHIFGMVLLNDWSARDIQKWEYVPLGPFLAKNFASTISAWIVTLDALEPFKVAGPEQDPQPLPYLQDFGLTSYDIVIQTSIKPKKEDETIISNTNFKNLYWSISQQLAHQTVNGCNVRSGDLYGSGTISGKEKTSYGSMLELTWKGTEPIKMSDGSERKFIHDGDTVIMRGYCKNEQVRIGFGECIGKVKKARKLDAE
ncbi:MAG: fumarylacetoacetase [Flavobacteriales bacterium]|nr:fumarylacetoacetase [Flavobacteriales bacterium]